MQGKSLEAVREYLEKRWDNEPVLPVYNAASFDTGHTLEERVANYKKLRELAVSIASKSPIKSLPRNPEFFSRCPSLQEIRRCWDIGSFKAEVEKAIANHPEWGYQVADGHILNRPPRGCRSMTVKEGSGVRDQGSGKSPWINPGDLILPACALLLCSLGTNFSILLHG